ncbi:MAG: LysR family transcriptional regulator [Caulobacteraceae bacterium]|nr:LysR family transcriptional regulator [Caulobacter sp.]
MPDLENFRLRVFRTVARHRNFSRAGEELFLTQPAVTQQIKALESELDTALFDRAGGSIQLTAAGQALARYAEHLASLSAEAVQAVAATTGEQGGDLRLGASQTIAQYVLPTFLAEFRKAHPRVHVTAISGNTDHMLAALVANEVQLALIEGPERRSDVRVEPFLQDHMVLVVPASHEWAGEEVTPAMLRNEPLLLREIGSGSRRVVEHALNGAGLKLKDLHISMELDSTEGLLSAVEAGLGVTFASHWTIRRQLALGTLRVARAKELNLARWFSLALLPGPAPKGNVQAFRTLLLRGASANAPRPSGKRA